MNLIKKKIVTYLLVVKRALSKESKETKDMLYIYRCYLRGEATKEDMKKANNQFRELLKNIGFGIVAILPFAIITIPFIVKLGNLLGINVLPASFQKDDKDEK